MKFDTTELKKIRAAKKPGGTSGTIKDKVGEAYDEFTQDRTIPEQFVYNLKSLAGVPLGVASGLAKIGETGYSLSPLGMVQKSIEGLSAGEAVNPFKIYRPVSGAIDEITPDLYSTKIAKGLGEAIPEVAATITMPQIAAVTKLPRLAALTSRSNLARETLGGVVGGLAKGEPETAAANAVLTPAMFGAGRLGKKIFGKVLGKGVKPEPKTIYVEPKERVDIAALLPEQVTPPKQTGLGIPNKDYIGPDVPADHPLGKWVNRPQEIADDIIDAEVLSWNPPDVNPRYARQHLVQPEVVQPKPKKFRKIKGVKPSKVTDIEYVVKQPDQPIGLAELPEQAGDIVDVRKMAKELGVELPNEIDSAALRAKYPDLYGRTGQVFKQGQKQRRVEVGGPYKLKDGNVVYEPDQPTILTEDVVRGSPKRYKAEDGFIVKNGKVYYSPKVLPDDTLPAQLLAQHAGPSRGRVPKEISDLIKQRIAKKLAIIDVPFEDSPLLLPERFAPQSRPVYNAKQVIGEGPGVTPDIDTSLIKNIDFMSEREIGNLPSGGGVGMVGEHLRDASRNLSRFGDSGRRAASWMDHATADERKLRAFWDDFISDIQARHTDDEWLQIDKALRGEKYKSTPQIDKSIKETRSMLNQIYNKVSEFGDNVRPYIPDYMPERGTDKFMKGMKSGKLRNYYSDWLKKNNPDLTQDTINEFMKVMDDTGDFGLAYSQMMKSMENKAIKAGSFYKGRTGAIPREFLRRDKGLLREYVEDASEQAARNRWLGEDFNKLAGEAGQMPAGSREQKYLNRVIKQLRAKGKPAETDLGKHLLKADKYSAFLLSEVSSMKNLLDVSKILGAEGSDPVLSAKVIGKSLTKEGKKKSFYRGIPEGIDVVKGKSLPAKYVKAIGMKDTEALARNTADLAGQEIAQKALEVSRETGDEFFIKVLRDLGVDVKTALRTGKLSPDDLAMAGMQMTKRLQGLGRVADYPLFATKGTSGTLMSKFKKQAYTTTTFLNDMIANAVKDPAHNALNAVILTGVLGTGGHGIAKYKEAKKDLLADVFGQKREEREELNLPEKFGQGMYEGIGLGMYGDTGRAMLKRGGIPEFFMGPTPGAVIDVVQSGAMAGWEMLKDQSPNATKTPEEKALTQLKGAGRTVLSRTPLNMFKYNILPQDKDVKKGRRKRRKRRQ